MFTPFICCEFYQNMIVEKRKDKLFLICALGTPMSLPTMIVHDNSRVSTSYNLYEFIITALGIKKY